MRNIKADEYIDALEVFKSRYVSCRPTEREQAFIDGIDFCINYVRFFAEEIGYEQITLADYMRSED